MDVSKKVIVCDLDGTLAESKSAITDSMVATIVSVLKTKNFAVISGGDWPQFEKQFLSRFPTDSSVLKNLFIFPTSGAECFRHNGNEWEVVYDELLTDIEKEKVMNAFACAIADSGVAVMASSYGDILEDRGEQITFSGCGQRAPLQIKSMWDPDKAKRRAIVDELVKHIPEFEITIGGMSSIDITRKGIHKAYAIIQMEKMLNVKKEEIIYFGDALYPGGNDTKAREAGVECVQVSGPEETERLLTAFIG